MATGTVKFFDRRRGFGFIVPDEGTSDIYAQQSDISGVGYRYLVEGEHISYEVGDAFDGRSKAVQIEPQQRSVGEVESFDHSRGFGFIRSEDGQQLFFHYTAILGSEQVKTATPGERVSFDVGSDERKGRAIADRVKRLDPRSAFYRFAHLARDEDWLTTLAGLAEEENWDYRFTTSAEERPILRSYVDYTFARLEQEGKVAYGGTEERPVAAFNTGLVTPNQQDIYAYFERNLRQEHDGCPWHLAAFHVRSDPQMAAFRHAPELAQYFDDPSVLLYDRRRELVVDVEHVISSRLNRFPEHLRGEPHQASQQLAGAIEDAKSRVYRNYKTAIPQFYRGEIQLLLPLCLGRPDRADLALVVERSGEIYAGNTVLTLDMAYNNARLITRPDADWLRP